jgi:formylglycine-generating enzyme required for sulfatase activity
MQGKVCISSTKERKNNKELVCIHGRRSFHNSLEYNAEYILIPGGSFFIGDPKQEARVSDLYFARYPVTFKQYHRFERYMESGELKLQKLLSLKTFKKHFEKYAEHVPGFLGYLRERGEAERPWFRSECNGESRFDQPDHPVVGVSLFEAYAYCFWVSALEWVRMGRDFSRKGKLEECAGMFRLPTEQEWEWAAAGREPEGRMREYPWGNGIVTDRHANFGHQPESSTSPVGAFPSGATPEGLMDMAGNVGEWTSSFYVESDTSRVVRGGSWYDFEGSLRSAFRRGSFPVLHNNAFGFRCVSDQKVHELDAHKCLVLNPEPPNS